MKLGKPKPRWCVVCTNGTPIACSGVRDAQQVAKRRTKSCWRCGEDKLHRVVEYRPVEEEPRHG